MKLKIILTVAMLVLISSIPVKAQTETPTFEVEGGNIKNYSTTVANQGSFISETIKFIAHNCNPESQVVLTPSPSTGTMSSVQTLKLNGEPGTLFSFVVGTDTSVSFNVRVSAGLIQPLKKGVYQDTILVKVEGDIKAKIVINLTVTDETVAEGAVINVKMLANPNISDMYTTFVFYDKDYLNMDLAEGEHSWIEFVQAFKTGGTTLQNVYNDAIYQFPATVGSFKGGWTVIDTVFKISAGVYDLVHTSYKANHWSHENFVDDVMPFGNLQNYEFKDGYRYEICLVQGLDNISGPTTGYFLEFPPAGAKIDNIIKPSNSASLGTNETVRLVFSGIGQNDLTEASIYLKVNEEVFQKSYSGNLKYQQKDSTEFTIDLSAKGEYTLKAWIVAGVHTSDTLKATIISALDVQPLPWRDDFDLTNSAWNIIDLNSDGDPLYGYWKMAKLDDTNICAVYWAGDNPGNDYLVTLSPFALEAGKNYHIIASAKALIASSPERIEAYYGTDPNPASMKLIGGYSVSNVGATWLERIFTFTASGDSNYYIAIKAASEVGMRWLYVDYVIVDTGMPVVAQDLAITAAEWIGVYASCEMPKSAKVAVTIENKGNGISEENWKFSYKLNNSEWKSGEVQEAIDAYGSITVYIDSLDLTLANTNTLHIAVNSDITKDDTVQLTIHTTENTQTPFISNFANPDDVENWDGQGAWMPINIGEYLYMRKMENLPGVGLMGKCVSLEAGKTYNVNIGYWGNSYPQYDGQVFPGMGVTLGRSYTSFDVRIGKPGDLVQNFKTLASFNEINTVENAAIINGKPDYSDYDTASINFSVENSGDYVLAIYPTEFSLDEWVSFFYAVNPYLGITHIDITEGARSIPVLGKVVNNLRAYPVPANNILNIDGTVKGLVSIIDMKGKIIMQHNTAGLGRIQLNILSLPSGTYMLQNGSQSIKFVKK